MTALRQSAMMELEKIPEDKLSFVIQIIIINTIPTASTITIPIAKGKKHLPD